MTKKVNPEFSYPCVKIARTFGGKSQKNVRAFLEKCGFKKVDRTLRLCSVFICFDDDRQVEIKFPSSTEFGHPEKWDSFIKKAKKLAEHLRLPLYDESEVER